MLWEAAISPHSSAQGKGMGGPDISCRVLVLSIIKLGQVSSFSDIWCFKYWKVIRSCQMPLPYQDDCSFCFCFICLVVLFQILNHLCIPGIHVTWDFYFCLLIVFQRCWIQFAGFKNLFIYYNCVCVLWHIYGGQKTNSVGLVLSLHFNTGSRDQTQVIKPAFWVSFCFFFSLCRKCWPSFLPR